MLLFQFFGGLCEGAVNVSLLVGAAKGVPVYVRGKGLHLLEEAVIVGQYKDVADGCFFFDEAYVVFRWQQVGFGYLLRVFGILRIEAEVAGWRQIGDIPVWCCR